jgi:hypothetical protein
VEQEKLNCEDSDELLKFCKKTYKSAITAFSRKWKIKSFVNLLSTYKCEHLDVKNEILHVPFY